MSFRAFRKRISVPSSSCAVPGLVIEVERLAKCSPIVVANRFAEFKNAIRRSACSGRTDPQTSVAWRALMNVPDSHSARSLALPALFAALLLALTIRGDTASQAVAQNPAAPAAPGTAPLVSRARVQL